MSKVKCTEREYKNFGRCLEISNGTIEALVTIECGPRIIRYAYTDGRNILREDIDRLNGMKGPEMDEAYGDGSTWYIYGGHRIWISPEDLPGSYYPDNDPVSYSPNENGATFVAPVQRYNELQIEMKVIMDPETGALTVTNRITNMSREVRCFAPWALTVTAQGGTSILPLNEEDTGLLGNRNFMFWPYADPRDPRFYFGHRYLTLHQEAGNTRAFKVGINNTRGWIGCVNGDLLLVKRFAPKHPGGVYPDNNCSAETYTNENFLELETLGVLADVAPGETAEHVENWSLDRIDTAPDFRSDEALDAFVKEWIER